LIIPKRYKLDRAASPKPLPDTELQLDCVHIIDGCFLASDGMGAARVPIVSIRESELPVLETGEQEPSGPVPLKAIREATKGKSGPGFLRVSESSTEAQAAAGKPVMRVDNPVQYAQVPNFDEAFKMASQDAPETHRYVEVCLDADLLARIAAAIGAEDAVRIRFLVNKETGKADAKGDAHGVVRLNPVDGWGESGVLMVQVTNE
jgi:hypothetical protein